MHRPHGCCVGSMLSCIRNEQDRVWHSGLCAFIGTAHARGPWGQGHKSDMEPALKDKHINMHGVPHTCIYTGAGNTEVRTRGGAGRWGGGGCTRGRDAGQRHEHRRGERCQSLPEKGRNQSRRETESTGSLWLLSMHKPVQLPISWLKTVGFGFLLLATKRKRKQNKTHHSRISPQAQPVPAPTTPVQPHSLAQ